MKKIFLLVPLILVCGCREQPHYGNFAKAESIDLVRDAVNAMMIAFPPAKTRLTLLHNVNDSFGEQLLDALRQHGYGVGENTGGKEVIHDHGGKDFAYVLDVLEEAAEMRVSLIVETDTLSRLYAVKRTGENSEYFPVGPWTRRH